MRLRIAWIALGLAAVQAAVGVVLALVSNEEGWIGALLYVCLYAVPLLLLGMALRSAEHVLRTAAGWVALALGVAYTVVVAVNWGGYSSAQAILAVGITVPTVVVDLAIFWAAAMPGRSGTSEPAAP